MKLHLPARLRSALLACLAVVAPLSGTVATGTFLGGAVVASLSLTEAQAAEVVVFAGATETYDASNTYVLKGGTLNVESGVVGSAVSIAAADSTIVLGEEAELSPLRVTLAEGVNSYKLIGSGTYDLASATDMYGANVSSSDWTGTVRISNSIGLGNFNINNYGNAGSTVKLSGVGGWLALGVAFNPTLLLEDTSDASALTITDGSSGREYAFTSVKGSGTFERGGTKFSGAVSYAFTGDISGWTGNFLNNYGQTTLIFRGGASEINLESITHNAGYEMALNFNGNGVTVVNSVIQSTGGGVINMTVNGGADVTFEKNVDVAALTANGAITVGSASRMTVSGNAALGGKLTVNGTLSLDNGATLRSSIVNNGTLNISGALVVESVGLAQSATGDSTFSDGANGFQQSGSIEYTVIENSASAKLNVSGVALSFDGDASLKLNASGKVVRKADPASTRYWVNSGDVSYSATNAATYFMNGGVLTLDKGDAAAQAAALIGVEGDKGTIKITADTSLSGEMVSKSACDLVVSGATLRVGSGEAQNSKISSFSSVTLENNAALFIEAQSSSINNLTVNETGARIDVKDTQGAPSSNPYVFAGVTTLHGTLTRTPNGGWGNGMIFEHITGEGSLEYTNNPNEQSYISIKSLKGFTGDLSFTQTNNNGGAYDVLINSGDAAVAMNTLTVGCIDKDASFRNISVQLDVARGMQLQQLNIRGNTNLNISGAAGLTVAEGVVVRGADNFISVEGDSALNLGTLSVQDSGALTLSGQYSALGMNQAGVVNLDAVLLSDGASLVYGADAAVLKVGSAHMLGSVKVDLNSLTDAQSLSIANGDGLDLGIDSSVSKSLIKVVSENVREAVLDNSGDTWKLKSGIVSMYWEAGSAAWNSGDVNWAFKDGGTPASAYVGGTDAIFTGDANAVVTISDSVDVQNIEIKDGQYTFNSEFDGDLVVKNDLLIGKNSVASFNKQGASEKNLKVQGDVQVGAGSALSINMDSVSILGGLSGAGKVSVMSDLSIGKTSSIGQLVVTGGVTMTGSGTDLSVGGKSSAASLHNVGRLTVTKGGSMTVASDTKVKSIAGEGTLNVGKLTLTAGASTMGSLKATSVTMGKGVSLSTGTLQSDNVNMVFGPSVVDGNPILTTESSAGDVALKLSVVSVDDLKKLTNGEQVRIAVIGKPGGDVAATLVAPMTYPADTQVVSKSDTEFAVTSNLRGFGYELLISPDKSSVVMQVGRDNDGWIGTENDTWSQGEQVGWETGFVPNPYDRAAGFFGFGSSIVNVDAAGVETALVDVDVAKNLLESKPSYTFVGGQVNTVNMVIGQGELVIANNTIVQQDAEVYTNGKLSVAKGGQLELGGNLKLTDDVVLTVSAGGQLQVGGALTAEKDVTITNAGTLSAGTVAIAGSVTNSELIIGDGGRIGSVKGGKLTLQADSARLQIGSASVKELQINGSGATVELTENSSIGLLCGNAAAADMSLISSSALVLRESATGAVNVTAKALTLNSVGNVLGTLNAPTLRFDLKDSALSADAPAISVESLVAVEPVKIILTQQTLDSLPRGEESLIAYDNYKLISGVSGHALSDFSVADSIMQEIKRRGVMAELKLQGDDLILSLGAIEGGMLWDTTDGNQLTNNGYRVPVGKGLYKALDYVERVLVTGNKTIDLTADGVGNAAEQATDPAAGLFIRNLDGGGKLTLVGDASGEDGILPDVVTLLSDSEAERPVELEADSLKVNIGLPEGVEGMLSGDNQADKVVLASAELKHGSVMQVNADASVKGQMNLTSDAALVVANGKVLSTKQLNGDETAVVSGKVSIYGVGGSYDGSYGAEGAELELHKGAYQSVRAGKGLTLLVSGGEGTLSLAGADAEMTKLGVGSGTEESRSLRSELVIDNVTLNDDANKVEHHTLSVTGTGSYISHSELTASLGAEETALTLGTENAPVIMDGLVNIDNSKLRLTMVTTKENLRSLDVNTAAPMKGAKLATLVTEGIITGDNEVELTGSRAMMNILNKYYTNARLSSSGDVLVDRVTDYYISRVSELTENGTVGVDMLDQVLVHLNPQANAAQYNDLSQVLNALDDAVVSGNSSAADKLAGAVSGASAAAMGAALAGDVERQLRAIRNRTTTMGVDQGTVNHNMPYFNAWINAEYDNRQLSQDSTLPGYDYSVTGGTVGFDVDITPRFVCGMAVSALTGDVTTEGADELEADVDSHYLSAFARATYRRWTHTFVASVGKSELSAERTVSFSGGSYRTKGETEAMGFGFMYELGYVFALDADATTCLQPVFNVSLAHSSMDGYTESGSDAALDVGSVDMTTLTIGMGARLQAVVGQNVFNRAAIFESRALVKVNAGDRAADVDTALTALPSAGGSVSSAERGPVSLELGAGITIPVGAKSGSIFVDGSAELGSEYTGLNATVGYRLNF